MPWLYRKSADSSHGSDGKSSQRDCHWRGLKGFAGKEAGWVGHICRGSACVWAGRVTLCVCLQGPRADVDSFLAIEEWTPVTNFQEVVATPTESVVCPSLPVVSRDGCPYLPCFTWPEYLMTLTAGPMVCLWPWSVCLSIELGEAQWVLCSYTGWPLNLLHNVM